MKYLDRFLSHQGDDRPDRARVGPTPARAGPEPHPSSSGLTSNPAKPAKGALGKAKGPFAGSAGLLSSPAGVKQAKAPTTRKDVRDPAVANLLAPLSIQLGDLTYHYSRYDGKPLANIWIGFDTETSLIQDRAIPDLALASASDGSEHRLIHPDRVGSFVLDHRGCDFICHNVAFDFWVVARHLELRDESEALNAWWTVADDNRMHDTMLLDELIRLARDDAYPRPRDLGVVAREYAGLAVDKSDPYRLRYAEIIGVDWSTVDPGFFDYAIKDPIATWATYQAMVGEAMDLMEAQAMIRPDALDRFGFLSEAIQIKASIFFAHCERQGMGLDPARLEVTQANLRRRLEELIALLATMPRCQDLFNRDRNGVIRRTPKGGGPSLSQARLRPLLEQAADAVAAETGRPVPVPRTATGKVSLAADDWEELAPFDPLVAAWIELGKTTKSLQFFSCLEGASINPRYTTLVRTGRTSCSAPNIQNLPRIGGFREAFVPRPGHLFLIVDYAYIELRTLAAEFLARYGSSRLADVIRDGVDPRVCTAAMFEGMELEAFLELRRSDDPNDRERYATLRQRAKVLNFGIPGGLGAASLVAYARSTYGVTLTLEEATEFRHRLIHEVYPELGVYLADDAMASLAGALGAPVEACWGRFDRSGLHSGQIAGAVKKVAQGRPHKADGTPYKPHFVEGVWDGLIALNRNPELTPLLAGRQGDEGLRARLFDSAVTTLTGRIRGRVRFTQAKNTPFQGLAADGAKLALWDLMRSGYKVVAFIHDEVIIEIPEGADYTAVARHVESIMNRAMEVVTGEVPVAVEYALSRVWSKKAKAVFDAQGRLVPCEIDVP